MKSKSNGGGPLDPPSGQVTVEVPDGVTRTFPGGEIRNNLMNADFVHGGIGACGYGAWPEENDSEPRPIFGRDPSRFRIG